MLGGDDTGEYLVIHIEDAKYTFPSVVK